MRRPGLVCLDSGFVVRRAVFAAVVGLAGCGDDGDAETAASTSEAGDTSTGEVVTTGDSVDDGTTSSTGGESTSDATSEPTSETTSGVTMFRVAGKLAYEYVPYDHEADRLDYGNIEQRPIRGTTVLLIDAESEEEIASGEADAEGNYSFEYEGSARVKLYVLAETTAPPIVVEDNTSQDAIYVLASAEVDSGADVALDVVATSGWTGAAYGELRAAAPFAVLDAAYTSGRRLLDEVTPAPEFPLLQLNWSVNNRPESGDVADGQIVTSLWNGSELFILGKEDVDTDEFDSHVIVHEWCHYFQGTLGRSDSPGGEHSFGALIDPRVAWGEGSCNAMTGIMLDPDSIYTDSSGPMQADGNATDFEYNNNEAAQNPGWYGELTVAGIVYDLYDGANEPFDAVELGLQPIYDAMIGLRETPALTTVFAYVSAVAAANPGAAADIDALVAFQQFDADFGISPVVDEWGTDETHTAALPGSLPLYADGVLGGMLDVQLVGGFAYNRLEQNRYIKIVGDGQLVAVESMCLADIDLAVYHLGERIADAFTGSGDEYLEFETIQDETYVLVVQGANQDPGAYAATITINP